MNSTEMGWTLLCLAIPVVIIYAVVAMVRWSDNRRPGIGGSYEGSAVRYAGELREDTWYRQLVEAATIAEQRRVGRGGYNEVHVKIPADYRKYDDFDINSHHDWLEKNGEQWGVYIDYE